MQVSHEYHTFDTIPKLENSLKRNLKKMGFDLMTPIQKSVVSYILEGRDVIGCARTGSGKTVAFLLPIINKMLRHPSEKQKGNTSYPNTIILVPTRELAEQIFKEARKIVHETGLLVTKIYGGVPQYPQKQ